MSNDESFGGETYADTEALSFVGGLLAKLQPETMVQRFVLIVETIEAKGKALSVYVAPGQKVWDTLGLIEYARTSESVVIGQHDSTDGLE